MIMMLILIATGWKPYLAPDISRRTIVLLGILIIVLTPFPIWLSPLSEYVQIKLHVSVCILLLASLLTFKGSEEWSYKGYLALCALMIAVIWGCFRKMYSYDPVFCWIDPIWDAPITAGLLCGAFTSQTKQQFSMIIWGSVLGETLNAALQAGIYTVFIGSLSWWDSFWITAVTAKLFSLMLKMIRKGLSKLSVVLWHMKGGRSS
jgi:hypothetical protein